MPRAIQARKMKGLLRGPSLFAARLGRLKSIGPISMSLTVTPSLRASDGTSSGTQMSVYHGGTDHCDRPPPLAYLADIVIRQTPTHVNTRPGTGVG